MIRKAVILCCLAVLCATLHATDVQPINLVFIGNSITYGATLSDPSTQAPPVKVAASVKSKTARPVYYKNCGLSGSATPNWLPGNSLYNNADAAATSLQAAHPGTLFFSIMLGTNDTHEGYKTTPEKYYQNIRSIIEGLMANHPEARFILNYPTWYSPNTHNSATYLEAGLQRLKSYMPMITKLGEFYQHSDRPQVWTGDSTVFSFFENQTQYFTAENGNDGVFYLHPNTTGGTKLADFWTASIIEHLNDTIPGCSSDEELLDTAHIVVAAGMKVKTLTAASQLLKASQITTNAKDYGLENLTDMNANTCFEVAGDDTDLNAAPYLQIDLNRTDLKQFILSLQKPTDTKYAPNDVVVYGADAPDATTWTRVFGLHNFSYTNYCYVSPLLQLAQPYRCLRLYVKGTETMHLGDGGALVYSLGELQLYNAEVDEEASPYYQQTTVRQACDSLAALVVTATDTLLATGQLNTLQRDSLNTLIDRVKQLCNTNDDTTSDDPNIVRITDLDGTGVYTIDKTKRLLTLKVQITANSTETNAGTYFGTGNLISTSTDYNKIIWHTAWLAASNPLEAGVDNYLQIKLKEAHSDICFTMIGSNWSSTYDTPDQMVIMVADDDLSSWKEVAELPDMIPAAEHSIHPAYYTSPRIDLGGSYKNIRFVIKETVNHRTNSKGNIYVSLARFQAYAPTPVEDPVAKLSALVSQLTALPSAYKVGTLPGCYDQEKVDAFLSQLTDATLLCCMNPTEEEATAMMEKLQNAYQELQSSQVPLTSGYYYLQSGYDAFETVQAEQKAIKAAFDTELMWDKYDTADASQLFYLNAKGENVWTVQNVGTGLYVGAVDAKTKRVSLTTDSTAVVSIAASQGALFSIKPADASYSVGIEVPKDGASTRGFVAETSASDQSTGYWTMVPLSDESLLSQLNQQADALQTIQAANQLSAEMMGGDSTALVTDASQLYANSEMSGFPVSNLLDKGTAYNKVIFHSVWGSGALPAGVNNYLQVHLNEAQSAVNFSMIGSSWSYTYDTPDDYVIMATDTPTDESSWQTVTRLYDMIPQSLHTTYPAYYTSPMIYMGKAYTDLRFVVMSTVNNRSNGQGNIYFSLARFQVYGAKSVSESLYGTVTGMREAVDQMLTMRNDLQNDLSSEAKLTALKQQIEKVRQIDEETGVTSIREAAESGAAYDLSGRKVTGRQKGIIIERGRKTLK